MDAPSGAKAPQQGDKVWQEIEAQASLLDQSELWISGLSLTGSEGSEFEVEYEVKSLGPLQPAVSAGAGAGAAPLTTSSGKDLPREGSTSAGAMPLAAHAAAGAALLAKGPSTGRLSDSAITLPPRTNWGDEHPRTATALLAGGAIGAAAAQVATPRGHKPLSGLPFSTTPQQHSPAGAGAGSASGRGVPSSRPAPVLVGDEGCPVGFARGTEAGPVGLAGGKDVPPAEDLLSPGWGESPRSVCSSRSQASNASSAAGARLGQRGSGKRFGSDEEDSVDGLAQQLAFQPWSASAHRSTAVGAMKSPSEGLRGTVTWGVALPVLSSISIKSGNPALSPVNLKTSCNPNVGEDRGAARDGAGAAAQPDPSWAPGEGANEGESEAASGTWVRLGSQAPSVVRWARPGGAPGAGGAEGARLSESIRVLRKGASTEGCRPLQAQGGARRQLQRAMTGDSEADAASSANGSQRSWAPEAELSILEAIAAEVSGAGEARQTGLSSSSMTASPNQPRALLRQQSGMSNNSFGEAAGSETGAAPAYKPKCPWGVLPDARRLASQNS